MSRDFVKKWAFRSTVERAKQVNSLRGTLACTAVAASAAAATAAPALAAYVVKESTSSASTYVSAQTFDSEDDGLNDDIFDDVEASLNILADGNDELYWTSEYT